GVRPSGGAGGRGGPRVAGLVGAAVPGPVAGVAVVGLPGGPGGVWQFSTDGGRHWTDFGTVYHGKARLLRAADRVRFVARAGGGPAPPTRPAPGPARGNPAAPPQPHHPRPT